jgi:hypothetical protein
VTGAQFAAGGEDRGAAAAVDGAVHSAAAQQRGVRRVDDRVHPLPGDVPEHELDPHAVLSIGSAILRVH